MGSQENDQPSSALGEDAVPEAAGPLVPAAQATRRIKSPQEQTGDKDRTDFPGNDIPTQTLAHLMKLHPCSSFFGWIADRQYPESQSAQTRFRRHKKEHGGLYWICVGFDLGLIVIAALILLAAVAVTLYKTLWL